MGFSVELATIVALFIGSVSWGINLVSFFVCMGALLLYDRNIKPLSSLNYTSIIATLLMFLIATFDMAVTVSRNIEWFVGTNLNTISSLSGISNWSSVAEISNLIAQAFIGDAILIYRCFVVWNRRWPVTVFPMATWLAGTACGVIGLSIGPITFYVADGKHIKPLFTTFVGLTAVTNFTSSSLILFRIWEVHQNSTRYLGSIPGRDPLARVIRIIIESGGLYIVSILLLLVTYLAGHNSRIIISKATIQLIGITFNLIIGRNARRNDSYVVPSNRHGTITSPGKMSIRTHVLVSHGGLNRASMSSAQSNAGNKSST